MIGTDRLLLRPPRTDDLPAFLPIRNSVFVLRFNAMEPLDEEQGRRELARGAASEGCWFLERRNDGALLGAIHSEPDELRWQVPSCSLSCYLAEHCARQGYMTEALGAVIPALLAREPISLLSARTFADNEGSMRMLEKLGFVREGVLRRAVRGWGGVVHDDVLWSLLREEYPIQK